MNKAHSFISNFISMEDCSVISSREVNNANDTADELFNELGRANLNHQLSERVADILHEVRNPLQTVKTLIQTMERISEDNSFINFYPKVMEELTRAEKLLNSYLSFTRKSEPEFAYVDLRLLCRKTVIIMRSGSIMKGVSVQEEYPEEEVMAFVDASRIRQVLINLMTNAFDACLEGGSVWIKLLNFDDRVSIIVADNGCGMDEYRLNRLFRHFLTTKPNGTGIGLRLVLEMVKWHGGHIDVHSKEGKGSVFSVVLPKNNPETLVATKDI